MSTSESIKPFEWNSEFCDVCQKEVNIAWAYSIASHYWAHHLELSPVRDMNNSYVGRLCFCGKHMVSIPELLTHLQKEHGGATGEILAKLYHVKMLGITP